MDRCILSFYVCFYKLFQIRLEQLIFYGFKEREEYIMLVVDTVATGNNIGVLRDKNGLTNSDIAKALGFTTKNAIYKWLNGLSMPSLDNLVGLSEIFKLSVDDILVTKNV